MEIQRYRKLQEELREKLKAVPLPKQIKYIAGADVSFNKFEKDVYAGIIVLTYPDLVPVEHAVVKTEVNFPYIPGYLSFREIPPLMKCWELLKTKLDLVVVDGHGIAHPRRLGIAAHFGLMIDTPTMGAAKNILYGSCEEPGIKKDSYSYIVDPKPSTSSGQEHERIGIALRTKDKVKPMLISPGHLNTVEDALAMAKTLVRKHRLVEPTRFAHNLVNSFRTGEIEAGHFTYPSKNPLF